MNKKLKTRMAIILDRSGSMASTKAQVIQGLNEQIQQAKEDSKDHDLLCSLVTFNGEVYEHLWDVPADKLVEAKAEDYNPFGSTACMDALGYTVHKLIETAPEDDKDVAYIVYVISDGQTNADHHFNPDSLKELVGGCQATKRWTFTFMGHDAGYLKNLARQTGVPLSNMAVWSNKDESRTKNAFQHQNRRQKKFFDDRKVGKMASAGYASESLNCVADFTEEAKDMLAKVSGTVDASIDANEFHDLGKLLENMPKYETHTWGESESLSLFGQTNKVSWKA